MLEDYALCPSQYSSAPALNWDFMLSMTKVNLNLFSDVDMYLFSENVVRGGVSIFRKKQQSKK